MERQKTVKSSVQNFVKIKKQNIQLYQKNKTDDKIEMIFIRQRN